MFCTKCGSEIVGSAKFCVKCGCPVPVKVNVEKPVQPKVEEPKAEAPKAEAPKVEAPKAEAPKVEAPKKEAPKKETPVVSEPKVEKTATNSTPVEPKNERPVAPAPEVKYEEAPKRMDNSDYYVKDVEEPVKKQKKKTPLGVRIICGFFTFIFSVVLFAVVLALFVRLLFDGSSLTDSSSKVYKNIKFEKLVVGAAADKLGTTVDIDEDAKISEYVYENLPENMKDEIDKKDMEGLIKDFGVQDVIAEIADDYIKVLTGEEDEVCISKDRIIEIIEDREDIIEDVTGYSLNKSDYKQIEEKLDEMELEKNTKFTYESGPAEDIPEIAKTGIKLFVGDKGFAYGVLGGAIGVLMVIIILLNLRKPHRALNAAGVNFTIVGVVGLAASIAFSVLTGVIEDSIKDFGPLISNLADGFKSVLFANSLIFLGVGVGLIVIYIVINIIVKAVSRAKAIAA